MSENDNAPAIAEDENEVRIKSELQKLPMTIAICGVFAVLLFVLLPTDVNKFGDFRYGSVATIIGRSIGSLILPGLFSLIFKKKSRAFVMLWLIFLGLSLAGLYAQYVIEPNSR